MPIGLVLISGITILLLLLVGVVIYPLLLDGRVARGNLLVDEAAIKYHQHVLQKSLPRGLWGSYQSHKCQVGEARGVSAHDRLHAIRMVAASNPQLLGGAIEDAGRLLVEVGRDRRRYRHADSREAPRSAEVLDVSFILKVMLLGVHLVDGNSGSDTVRARLRERRDEDILAALANGDIPDETAMELVMAAVLALNANADNRSRMHSVDRTPKRRRKAARHLQQNGGTLP